MLKWHQPVLQIFTSKSRYYDSYSHWWGRTCDYLTVYDAHDLGDTIWDHTCNPVESNFIIDKLESIETHIAVLNMTN